MLAALAAFLLLLAQQPGGVTDNWADEKSALTSTPEFAASKATCRRLGDPQPPRADRPTPAQTRALKGCDSEKLYYGQGAKPDYVRARQCALVEAEGEDAEVFGGSTILMQIYANGLGAVKNLDLATAYACRIDGAPAERDGRVKHLQALKAKPAKDSGRPRFDYCDDITSGLYGGFCSARDSAGKAPARDAKLKGLVARLPPAARPLYPPMKTAFDAFVDAHDGEVDQSGTARATFIIEEEDETRAAFAKTLAVLLSGRWPRATGAEARAADAQLNAAYRKAIVFTGSKDNFSTTKPKDVQAAQRAWLAWRDRFVAFARAAAPGVSADAVLERLTSDRIPVLEQLSQ